MYIFLNTIVPKPIIYKQIRKCSTLILILVAAKYTLYVGSTGLLVILEVSELLLKTCRYFLAKIKFAMKARKYKTKGRRLVFLFVFVFLEFDLIM